MGIDSLSLVGSLMIPSAHLVWLGLVRQEITDVLERGPLWEVQASVALRHCPLFQVKKMLRNLAEPDSTYFTGPLLLLALKPFRLAIVAFNLAP
jgi:hypothetical protein